MSNKVPALQVNGSYKIKEKLNGVGKVCGPFTVEVLLYELKKIGLDATVDKESVHVDVIVDGNGDVYSRLTLDMMIVGLGDNNITERLFLGFLKNLAIEPTLTLVCETTMPGVVVEDDLLD